MTGGVAATMWRLGFGRSRRAVAVACGLGLSALLASPSRAQESPGASPDVREPGRPTIQLTRWTEDWGPLADERLRTEPFDHLKHVSLSDMPGDRLSLGANVRERFEHQDGFLFGAAGARSEDYVLSRVQAHADLRLAGGLQAFAQLEDVRTSGLDRPGPADVNRLDLAQAFVGYRGEVGGWRYGLRVGRQEISFDLERFVSIREGPNVRQRFDAVWGELDNGRWSIRALVSEPVQYESGSFDDVGDGRLRLHAIRVERRGLGPGDLSFYVAHYERAGARFGGASGRERREILDVRYFKSLGRLQLDLEVMGQLGAVAGRKVRAWALGARTRYLVAEAGWSPKVGVQFDAASGDSKPSDKEVGTFNPLFPNGLYFTQAGYTGYVNLLHLKPTVTLEPSRRLTLLGGLGLQWRATTADAVYAQPAIPIPGTAGRRGRRTGTYGQARVDWRATANVHAAAEVVHFAIGDAIRRAGGQDSTYAGLEVAVAW